MLNKSNTKPTECEIFRTWWLAKPLEEAQKLRNEIMGTGFMHDLTTQKSVQVPG